MKVVSKSRQAGRMASLCWWRICSPSMAIEYACRMLVEYGPANIPGQYADCAHREYTPGRSACAGYLIISVPALDFAYKCSPSSKSIMKVSVICSLTVCVRRLGVCVPLATALSRIVCQRIVVAGRRAL